MGRKKKYLKTLNICKSCNAYMTECYNCYYKRIPTKFKPEIKDMCDVCENYGRYEICRDCEVIPPCEWVSSDV